MIDVGIDVIKSDRFKGRQFCRTSPLLRKMFSSRELAYCFSKRNTISHLATHFAAKEALWKALSGNAKPLSALYPFLREVEIMHSRQGKPHVVFLSDSLREYRAFISMADSDSHAVAVAAVERITA